MAKPNPRPMSDLFHKKTEKEYQQLCDNFYTELTASLTEYLEENMDKTDNVVGTIRSVTYDNVDVKSIIKSQETWESNESQSEILSNYSDVANHRSILADCLIQLLLNGFHYDLKIRVKSETFLAHKSVLYCRSSYFQAMLRNDHEGVSVENFAILLLFIYGALVDLSEFTFDELISLASDADMYATMFVMNAVEFYVKKEKCHFFHKPCQGCLDGMKDGLYLSNLFNLSNLREKCLKWSAKHFKQLWATKKFCMQRKEIHEECYNTVASALCKGNVTSVMLDTDALILKIDTVSWGLPIASIVHKLMTSCMNNIMINFVQLAKDKSFLQIFQGIGCRTDLVESLFEHIMRNLSIENACSLHIGGDLLLNKASREKWSENVIGTLKALDNRITSYILNNYHGVLHTEQWQMLSSEYRRYIQQNTLCVGDVKRKPRRKPILSSSMRELKH
uniref:uncharacterized protein LOC100177736 isoform X2 n=1 Tax=Ciona intestinalis TaxID=7719 RepID=UPI000EF52E53|nr:uncharacterized protein LOC100177736 isoform X2 [Ciona intestinalis]|eukprot:XP_026695651.1 uncharacterized protein LOC100177736 isoform X2 [Ciona intestinalis]